MSTERATPPWISRRVTAALLTLVHAGCTAGQGLSGAGGGGDDADDQTSTGDAGSASASSSSSSGGGGAGGGGSGAAPRSTGSVEDHGPVICPPEGGTACRALTVTCDGIPPIEATLAVTDPIGELKGTVFLHMGGGGTTVQSQSRLVLDGFRTVSVAWATDWEALSETDAGIKRAACRPATLMRWVFHEVHGGRRDLGFCARAASGGSGAIAYALAHYGLEDYLDLAQLLAGPPFGRIDCGCLPDAPGCGGSTHYLCPELPAAPVAYNGGTPDVSDWENAPSCGTGWMPDSEIARLAEDSVVSPGADFDYPRTPVHAWYCANGTSNETTGLGAFYVEKLSPPAAIECVTAACTGEVVEHGTLPDGTPAREAIRLEMEASCVPRHM